VTTGFRLKTTGRFSCRITVEDGSIYPVVQNLFHFKTERVSQIVFKGLNASTEVVEISARLKELRHNPRMYLTHLVKIVALNQTYSLLN